jgi:hypothetical protein
VSSLKAEFELKERTPPSLDKKKFGDDVYIYTIKPKRRKRCSRKRRERRRRTIGWVIIRCTLVVAMAAALLSSFPRSLLVQKQTLLGEARSPESDAATQRERESAS